MAEACCFPNKLQGSLNANPLKKSPLLLKMIALAAAMVCGLSVCSVFLEQMKIPSKIQVNRVNLVDQSLLRSVRIDLTDKKLVNSVRVNSTEHSLPLAIRANLTKKTSHDPKLLQTRLRNTDYNNTGRYRRKEKLCVPISLYAIVSMQRSGSKWFEALLDSHDDIRSHGEIFRDVDRKCNMTVIRKLLNKVYGRSKKNCFSVVGFKWMLNQGILDNLEEIVDYFNHRGVSVILLFRRNHLRRLVSLKANNHDGIAKNVNGTHKAHVFSKEEAVILERYKPKLYIKGLIPTLEHMERLATDALNNFRSTRHMVVYYEDLVRNQTQKMNEVLEFLKVPRRKLISNHVKIHTKPLAQQIGNWRDVVKAVNRSKYRGLISGNA